MKSIESDALEQMLGDGGVRLVDVLPEEHFAKVHIPGAENVPLATLRSGEQTGLGRADRIVVYCSSRTCDLSPQAATLLEAQGYRYVFDFEGGLLEWIRSGREVVRPTNPTSAT